MKKKSVISWLDVLKLAIGIMVGITPMLLIFINYSTIEPNVKSDAKPILPVIVENTEKEDSTIYDESLEEYEYKMSVEEILEERERIRYEYWIDSIYLAMPEKILVYILNENKTDRTSQGIVEEYVKNKKEYNKLIK